MIASARMYEWSPSLVRAWRTLLEWVSRRARANLEVLDRGSISLEEIWARDDMACVFMCGYPWALSEIRPALLAAPVPSPPRYRGRPEYVSDFVVRADGPWRSLEDTFGGTIAFSTEWSHSGYNAARYHLLRYLSPGQPGLFARAAGPYMRQRRVIEAVLQGEADVAAIDGYACDLLRRHDPEVVARLRIIATTAPAPAPPLVASPGLPADVRARIQEALLRVHTDPTMAEALDDLLLTRFAPVNPEAFDLFLAWQRAAERAGYPKLA
jgi:ABC-type phosphate/phosphonate transport system substrate-binding protein